MKKLAQLFILFPVILSSCLDTGDDLVLEVDSSYRTEVAFNASRAEIVEGKGFLSVEVQLSEPLLSTQTVEVEILTENAELPADFRLFPAFNAGRKIILNFQANSTSQGFRLLPINDQDSEIEKLQFRISAYDSTVLQLGPDSVLSLSIVDELTIDPQFENFIPEKEGRFRIVTWNLDLFPKRGSQSIDTLQKILRNIQADVVIFQQVRDLNQLRSTASGLGQYRLVTNDIGGVAEKAILINRQGLQGPGRSSPFINADTTGFLREPILNSLVIERPRGLTVERFSFYIFNLHLPEGSDNSPRRSVSSFLLKEKISETFDSQELLVIAGTFNENIMQNSNFENFLSDGYVLADRAVQEGPEEFWSLQSEPNHFDHFILSNSLSLEGYRSFTIQLDECVDEYFESISRHYPLVLDLNL